MSAQTEVIRGWWDAMNNGTALDAIERTYAPGYVLHDPSVPGGIVEGLDGVRGFVSGVLGGFPDGQMALAHVVEQGDLVMQRVLAKGTHQGEFNGIPATGKPIDIEVWVISRFENGKVAEEWQLVDGVSMLQQLGVMPAE